MEHCGFFDARLEAGEYDRVYTADQHAQYFASFIGNGVFKYNPILGVVESTTPGLSVTLTPGQAWINGYWYKNDEDLELPIALPDESQPRIDAVAIRWNSITRDIKAVVIQGEPNSTPIAPTPVRDMVNFDLILAHVRVNASALRIEDANITDTRVDFDICGFVYTLIDRGEEASLERQLAELRDRYDNQIPIIQKEAFGHKIFEDDTFYYYYAGGGERTMNIYAWKQGRWYETKSETVRYEYVDRNYRCPFKPVLASTIPGVPTNIFEDGPQYYKDTYVLGYVNGKCDCPVSTDVSNKQLIFYFDRKGGNNTHSADGIYLFYHSGDNKTYFLFNRYSTIGYYSDDYWQFLGDIFNYGKENYEDLFTLLSNQTQMNTQLLSTMLGV